tara:strand:- start:2484 stop:3827 length:1344 start_codon:yes stop_codon:yes gene_type:complete
MASSSLKAYTSLALQQFVDVFSQVVNDKDLVFEESGNAIKQDVLFRMMYEKIMAGECEPVQAPASKVSTMNVNIDETRSEKYTGIKVSFKDIKKIEKKLNVTLPFMPEFIDYSCDNQCCGALRVNGNLFVPCGTHVKSWDGEGVVPVCKTCEKQGNIEKYGSLKDRMDKHAENQPYESPVSDESGDEEDGKKARGPKKVVSFGTYLAKKGDLGSEPLQHAANLMTKIGEIETEIFTATNIQFKIPSEHLSVDRSKVRAPKKASDPAPDGKKRGRGRPKKVRSPSVDSTSSEEQTPVEQPIVAEEPVKDTAVVVPAPVETTVEKPAPVETTVEKPAPVDKSAEKKKKKKKKAEAAAKAQAEAKAKAEAEAKAKAEAEANNSEESEDSDSDSDEEEEETTTVKKSVKPFTHDGVKYFLDKSDFTIYNEDMEYVGDYNKETGMVELINED